jgi:phage tail sheath protein FI
MTRGQIKNVIKFAIAPTKQYRDTLYKNNINPIVAFPGEGNVVWGQKTMLSAPSAFDRINVRRLFILLEKAIASSAKYMIFEFNDEYQRNLFKLMVEPFLRRVKGRRGLYDYLVVCDSSNNPGAVIDANEFVGDIYIKPNRSAEFIRLNFIAVGTDVNFSEVTISNYTSR